MSQKKDENSHRFALRGIFYLEREKERDREREKEKKTRNRYIPLRDVKQAN